MGAGARNIPDEETLGTRWMHTGIPAKIPATRLYVPSATVVYCSCGLQIEGDGGPRSPLRERGETESRETRWTSLPISIIYGPTANGFVIKAYNEQQSKIVARLPTGLLPRNLAPLWQAALCPGCKSYPLLCPKGG